MPSEKASSSCFRCRTKRTKCDEKRPSCTQCIRAGAECHGYRDAWSLSFRNQTQSICRKYNSSVHTESFDMSNAPLPRELVPSHEDQALQSFFFNYAQSVGPGSFTSQYGYDEIPHMLTSASNDCPLKNSAICLGTASLTKRTALGPDVQRLLDATYSRALRIINKALRDPTFQTSDEVFMSVLLLGLYEQTIKSTKHMSDKAWAYHMNGLVTLIDLRGDAPFRTSLGVRMFGLARQQIVANCSYRRIIVPDIITKGIPPGAMFTFEGERLANDLAALIVRFSNSRARLCTTDLPNEPNESAMLVPELLAIDSELSKWAYNYAGVQSFHTVPLLEPISVVFGAEYHIYDSVFSASIWNNYRNIRLSLNAMLRPRLHRFCNDTGHFTEYSTIAQQQLEVCLGVLDELALDVCASVPFVISRGRPIDRTLSECSDISGNLLVWPMYTAGATRQSFDDPIRLWVVRMLHKISAATGYEQAARQAAMLENPDHRHGMW